VPTNTFAIASADVSKCHLSHNASNKLLNQPLLAVEKILNTAMTNMRFDLFAVPEPSGLLLLVIAMVASGVYVCSHRC